MNGRHTPGLFTWDLRIRQLTNSYYHDRSAQFMAWDASTAWVVFSTCVAGFLNWCHYRSVWLSVQQFVPYFLWVGAWWLLITRRPPYYKRYRQPLVLLMRCGALISEARALRDGDEMVLLGVQVPGWPRLTLLLKLFLLGLVPYTCLEVIALQVPFILQLAHIVIKLFFVCHNRSVQQMVQLAQQPPFRQATKQLLDGWVEFVGQSNWNVLLQHPSVSDRSCDMTLLFVLFSVTTSVLLLWSCYLFSLTDLLQWLRQKEEMAISMPQAAAAAAYDDDDEGDPGRASIMIGSVWVTAAQLAAAHDSAFVDTLLSVHPSGPVVTLVAHIVVLGCICCGSAMISQLAVLQLLPRLGSAATLDLYCPKMVG